MQQLRRDLGLPQAMLTVIGIVIGSGIFALPAVVFGRAGTPGLGLLAWVLGGLVTLAAGLTVSELTAAMPRAGGTYIFLREAYGEWLAFLQGWSYLLTYNSALNAALAMIFTTYLTSLIPLSGLAQKLVALSLIAALSLVNCFGVRFGALLQMVATIGKLAPIALLTLFGLARLDGSHLAPLIPPDASPFSALAGAVLPVLWAYDGWIQVGLLAEEVKNPQRNLPLALIGGLSAIIAIYALFNLALVGVVPFDMVTASEKPVIPMATALFGDAGARLITVGMLVSMFGSLNALVMTAPRYYLAMARDGLFPAAETVARLHPRYQTPVAAIVISAAWSAVIAVSGSFAQIIDLVVLVAWLFNTLSMAAVIVLRRKRPDMERPYRCWGYPVVPLIGIGSGVSIVISLLLTEPATSAIGTALTLTGLPVYAWLSRNRNAA